MEEGETLINLSLLTRIYIAFEGPESEVINHITVFLYYWLSLIVPLMEYKTKDRIGGVSSAGESD